jgi:hypothetical protein
MKKVRILTVLFVLTASGAQAATIRMEQVGIEGHVQKPEVMFISDRAAKVPDRDGLKGLRQNFLKKIVDESRQLAQPQAR